MARTESPLDRRSREGPGGTLWQQFAMLDEAI